LQVEVGAPRLTRVVRRAPNAVECQVVALDAQVWDVPANNISRALHVAPVALRFLLGIAEGSVPSIGAAVGVVEQEQPRRLMKADGGAELVEEKIASTVGREQIARAAGNADPVAGDNAEALEELDRDRVEAAIEAADESGVGAVQLAVTIEVQELLHGQT